MMVCFSVMRVWLEDVFVPGVQRFSCKTKGGLAKSLRTTVLGHVSHLWFKPLNTLHKNNFYLWNMLKLNCLI